MSLESINSALVDAIRNGLGWDEPMASENKGLTAEDQAGVWMRFTNFPTSSLPDTLGDAGEDRCDGYLQLDIFAPGEEGSKFLLQRFDAARLYFKAGSGLVYNGQRVKIRRAEPSPIRRPEAGGKAQISLFIYWSAWLPR